MRALIKQTEAARTLRRQQTEAEQELWKRLRNRQLGRFKFRRQFSIGPFFADFCCFEKKLIIELDGNAHRAQADEDENRTAYLIEQGYKVLRFWNKEIIQEMDIVCKKIEEALRQI